MRVDGRSIGASIAHLGEAGFLASSAVAHEIAMADRGSAGCGALRSRFKRKREPEDPLLGHSRMLEILGLGFGAIFLAKVVAL